MDLAIYPDSFVYAQDRIRVDGGVLTISNINLMDSGMYQCLAENDNGVIYASAELKVVGKHLSLKSKSQSFHMEISRIF